MRNPFFRGRFGGKPLGGSVLPGQLAAGRSLRGRQIAAAPPSNTSVQLLRGGQPSRNSSSNYIRSSFSNTVHNAKTSIQGSFFGGGSQGGVQAGSLLRPGVSSQSRAARRTGLLSKRNLPSFSPRQLSEEASMVPSSRREMSRKARTGRTARRGSRTFSPVEEVIKPSSRGLGGAQPLALPKVISSSNRPGLLPLGDLPGYTPRQLEEAASPGLFSRRELSRTSRKNSSRRVSIGQTSMSPIETNSNRGVPAAPPSKSLRPVGGDRKGLLEDYPRSSRTGNSFYDPTPTPMSKDLEHISGRRSNSGGTWSTDTGRAGQMYGQSAESNMSGATAGPWQYSGQSSLIESRSTLNPYAKNTSSPSLGEAFGRNANPFSGLGTRIQKGINAASSTRGTANSGRFSNPLMTKTDNGYTASTALKVGAGVGALGLVGAGWAMASGSRPRDDRA